MTAKHEDEDNTNYIATHNTHPYLDTRSALPHSLCEQRHTCMRHASHIVCEIHGYHKRTVPHTINYGPNLARVIFYTL